MKIIKAVEKEKKIVTTSTTDTDRHNLMVLLYKWSCFRGDLVTEVVFINRYLFLSPFQFFISVSVSVFHFHCFQIPFHKLCIFMVFTQL